MTGSVTGSVVVPADAGPLRTYVGLFPSPVIEGLPVAFDVLEGSGVFTLRGVPCRTWYLRAAAVPLGEVDPRPWLRRVASFSPVREVVVRPGSGGVEVDVGLRPATILDPPLVLALPELDNFGTAHAAAAAACPADVP